MRRAIGIGCIILGLTCLICAAGLVFYNRQESNNAAESSREMLHQLQELLPQSENPVLQEEAEPAAPLPSFSEVPMVQDCIGILSIPVLEVELPVLSDWSYEKLKKAPCQYFGSCENEDFVIAAHNYPSHFGRLSELQRKDLVLFTDLNGTIHYYEVILIETLAPTATEAMITSGFPLSLYTCTPGGGSRVTVRCSNIE